MMLAHLDQPRAENKNVISLSSRPDRFFQSLLPEILETEQSESLPRGVMVVFHIEGEGGGSWKVFRHSAPNAKPVVEAIADDGDRRIDCEMTCQAGDFMELITGKLDPRRAYLSGRIKLKGDIGLVLRLQSLVVSRAA